MNYLLLTMYPDGDITITNVLTGERVYHRSYNAGDVLSMNLLSAYEALEALSEDHD